MITATSSFMDTLEKWLQAVKTNDFASAKSQAQYLVKAGELLTCHPDFIHCFAQHYPEVDPHDALLHMCQMLVCATDGRARVLKQWVADNSPATTLKSPRNL